MHSSPLGKVDPLAEMMTHGVIYPYEIHYRGLIRAPD